MVVVTVADLIQQLQQVPGTTSIYTIAPPFSGVRVIPQVDGKILLAPPEDKK
jgi:hypothetical protein